MASGILSDHDGTAGRNPIHRHLVRSFMLFGSHAVM